MFLLASVILSGGRGSPSRETPLDRGPWKVNTTTITPWTDRHLDRDPPEQRPPRQTEPPGQRLTSSGDHQSRRYASYWNAYLTCYHPQTKFAKVMFLHLSVILFTGGGCLPQCMLGYTPPGPEADPPQDPRQTPPCGRYASYWNAYLLPPTNEVAGRLCFYRCL